MYPPYILLILSFWTILKRLPLREACAMADGRQAKELTNNFLYSTGTDCFLRAPPPHSTAVHKKRRRCRHGNARTQAAARRPRLAGMHVRGPNARCCARGRLPIRWRRKTRRKWSRPEGDGGFAVLRKRCTVSRSSVPNATTIMAWRTQGGARRWPNKLGYTFVCGPPSPMNMFRWAVLQLQTHYTPVLQLTHPFSAC
jgi:hypothetical protein